MARSIREPLVTPADELRNLLAEGEKLVVRLRGANADAPELFRTLDRIAELWPELEEAGVDLRPEAGRWESLQASVRGSAGQVVRGFRSEGGIAAARARAHPDGKAGWWWYLDAEVRAARRKLVLRIGIIAGGVALVLMLASIAIRVFFPVDPRYQAAVSKLLDGQAKIQYDGDYKGAQADFEQAISLKPDEVEAWLWLGGAQQKLGERAAAEESFRRARELQPDDVAFKLGRAQVYLAYSLLDQARADAEAVLGADAENPQAYLLLGVILEAQQRYEEAAQALQRAGDFAEKRGQPQISATARYQMGLLLQRMPLVPQVTPTSTPP